MSHVTLKVSIRGRAGQGERVTPRYTPVVTAMGLQPWNYKGETTPM